MRFPNQSIFKCQITTLKRLESRKREQTENKEESRPKRRRRLEFPVIEESWGEQEPPRPVGCEGSDGMLSKREHPSLAGSCFSEIEEGGATLLQLLQPP